MRSFDFTSFGLANFFAVYHVLVFQKNGKCHAREENPFIILDFFPHSPDIVVSQKSVYKVRTMAAAEFELKSPFRPPEAVKKLKSPCCPPFSKGNVEEGK